MTREWSLSGLFRFRQLREDQAAAELAVMNGRERTARAAETRARRRLGELGMPGTDPNTLKVIAITRAVGASMLGELRVATTLAAADAQTAKDRFREARRETASLEKLQERHVQQVLADELRTEQNTLDELTSSRFRTGKVS